MSLGEKRVKFPGLSMERSASLYLVYYLKMNNPNNEPHTTEKYAKKVRLATASAPAYLFAVAPATLALTPLRR